MDSESPGPEWVRLGNELVARRTALGYPKRKAFAEAKGFKNDRVIAAIENAERTNYTRGTLAAFEFAYEWAFGSIATVLAGGVPIPHSHSPNDYPDEPPPETISPFDPGGAALVDPEAGEWMSAQTVRDGNGKRVAIGTSVATDRDGVVTRVEVRFWPGDERRIHHAEFVSVLGDAHRAALRALMPADEDFGDVTPRVSHLQAARSGKSEGRQIRQAQDDDADHPQDDGDWEPK